MKRRSAALALLSVLSVSAAYAAGREASVAEAASAFSALGALTARDVAVAGAPVPAPAATPDDKGVFLYNPRDRKVLFCSESGCRTSATDVVDVLPDGLRGLYVFRSAGVSHCGGGACATLDARLAFASKFTRGARLYGTSPSAGTWTCEATGCRRLTEAFFDSTWPGGFDATGFWASGPQGTWRCGETACRKLADVRLEILFSVGTPGGRGLAWGGDRRTGTWRCTETACASVGGPFWYNGYAFDAEGNLFGSSAFPDSSYACSAAGCRKLDDRYHRWHGPDGRGGMIASTQVPAETQRCDLTGCKKTADGAPSVSQRVIDPVAAAVPAALRRPGYSQSVVGTDDAVYGVRARTAPRLERRAAASAPAELTRSAAGEERVLGSDAPVLCWSWEYDEDKPSAWDDGCAFY